MVNMSAKFDEEAHNGLDSIYIVYHVHKFNISLDWDSEGSYIEFFGRSSKNFNGGIKQRKIEAKSLKHYSDSGNDISLYDMFKLYLDLVGNDGPFYKLPQGGPGDKLRYSSQAVGVNKLSTIIKTIWQKRLA